MSEISFKSTINQINVAILEHRQKLDELHTRIGLIRTLGLTIDSVADAQVAEISYMSRNMDVVVSLPNIETLGTFLRELDHMQSKYLNAKLTYSGTIKKDLVNASLKISFKEAEG